MWLLGEEWGGYARVIVHHVIERYDEGQLLKAKRASKGSRQ